MRQKSNQVGPINISPGERLIAKLRPSWCYYIRYFPIVIVTFLWWHERNILFIFLFFLGFLLILSRYSNLYLITTHRVVEKRGFIALYTHEIDLASIQLIKIEQGIVDRLVGTGRIVIESAGQNGKRGDVIFGGVENPIRVKELLFRLKNRKKLKNYSRRRRLYRS